MSQTAEHAFESYVEEILLTKGAWKSGSLSEWDKDRGLFPAQVFGFIEETQPKAWGEIRKLHAAGLEALLLAALVKELDAKGSLHVLRHGFKFYGKTFRLATFKPAHGANYEVLKQFGKNRLTLTRQVPCHPGKNAHAGHGAGGERPACGDDRAEESRCAVQTVRMRFLLRSRR